MDIMFVLIGIAILLYFPAILALIGAHIQTQRDIHGLPPLELGDSD